MPTPSDIPSENAALPRETGGFRLLRTLGRGGMGVVYEAEELASSRRVALKILVPELAVSEEAFERFRREARIAASISDSSCVFVFGAHQIDGAPAIAMELCAGETLEHRLSQREPVPVEDAVRWTIEILDGLEAAHRVGVVHRDVKPSNCFITAEGRIKVGDFGLARSLERDVQLTRSGVFLGSPLYASPEQVRGRHVDFRSDLYSVGATLYALLTGRSPYTGDNLGEVLARILSESPEPPSSLRKEIPPALDKLVLRAMAREPAQRFQSHAEMREALRAFLPASSAPAGPLRRLLAFGLDAGVLALLQLPLFAVWTHLDPDGCRPLPRQPWRLQSDALLWVQVNLDTLYFAVAEGVFSRSVGKWLTGQRVVVVDGASRAALRRVLRAAVWTCPGFIALVVGYFQGGWPPWAETAIQFLPWIGILILLSTMRRKNGWRGVHELASGTRVVAEPLPFERFVRHESPPTAQLGRAGGMPEQVGAYSVVGRVGSTRTGEILEASDVGLDRRVWVHARDLGAAPLAPERRSLERATHLRWLDGFEERGRRHEVFEAPGGASLQGCCAGAGRLPWPVAHAVLSTLAAHLEREPARRIGIEQLWIDRAWNLRILDEPLEASTPAAPSARPSPSTTSRTAAAMPAAAGFESGSPGREPLDLLALVAQTALGVLPGSRVELPPDLPEHAEGAARRLVGLDAPFESLAEARRALAECANRPQGLTWKIRGLQMLVGSAPAVVFSGMCVAGTHLVVLPQARELRRSEVILQELRAGRRVTAADVQQEPTIATGAEIDAQGLRARSLLVAEIQDRLDAPPAGIKLVLTPEERELVARMHAEHGDAPREEVAAARAQLAADRLSDPELERSPGLRIMTKVLFAVPFGLSVIWGMVAILGALILRGGGSFRMMSLAVRDSRGRRAGRVRCAWRALFSALPFVALYGPPIVLVKTGHPTWGTVALAAALLLHLLLVAVSLRTPARGWQDRLAGTRLVPR